MHELQTVLDQAGDGQRLARRLLSVGVEPHDAPKSEQSIRVGRAAIERSTAALERALRRETSPRRSEAAAREAADERERHSSSARRASAVHRAGLRVLGPGIDSYLEEYTPRARDLLHHDRRYERRGRPGRGGRFT